MMYVWIPFGERLHDYQKDGELPSDKPAWWVARAKILRDFVLPSLKHQTKRDFKIVAGIADIHLEIAIPVTTEILLAGGRIFPHKLREQHALGQEPHVEWLLRESSENKAGFWAVHLDSDDMYVKDALARIVRAPATEGTVAYFDDGFIMDSARTRAYVYHPGTCPAPFFARWYPGWLSNQELTNYRMKYKYMTHHHQLPSCPGRFGLGHAGFCVLSHSDNTTTGLDVEHIKAKCKKQVSPRMVCALCGII